MMFCKEYNARTADQPGMIIPVEITVFEVSERDMRRHARVTPHALRTHRVFCPLVEQEKI